MEPSFCRQVQSKTHVGSKNYNTSLFRLLLSYHFSIVTAHLGLYFATYLTFNPCKLFCGQYFFNIASKYMIFVCIF